MVAEPSPLSHMALSLQGHPVLVKLQSRLDSQAPVSTSSAASRIVSTASAPGEEGVTCGGMTGVGPAEFGPDPSALRACIEETRREVAAQAAMIDWDDASLVSGGWWVVSGVWCVGVWKVREGMFG